MSPAAIVLGILLAAPPGDAVRLVEEPLPPRVGIFGKVGFVGAAFAADGSQLAYVCDPVELDRPSRYAGEYHAIDFTASPVRDESKLTTDLNLGAGGDFDAWGPFPRTVGTGFLARQHDEAAAEVLRLVDLDTAALIVEVPNTDGIAVQAVAMSADLRVVAYCGASTGPDGWWTNALGRVAVWDSARKQWLIDFTLPNNHFSSVVLSPDGNLAAATSAGSSPPQVFVWDVRAGRLLWSAPYGSALGTTLAFDARSQSIVVGVDASTVRWWDAMTGNPGAQIDLGSKVAPWVVNHLEFSADGSLLAVGLSNWNRGQTGGEIQLWDAIGRKRLAVQELDQPITSITFSPDGSRFAACTRTDLRLWRLVRDDPRVAAAAGVAMDDSARGLGRFIAILTVAGLMLAALLCLAARVFRRWRLDEAAPEWDKIPPPSG